MPLKTPISQQIRNLSKISGRALALSRRLSSASRGLKRTGTEASSHVAKPLRTDALDIPVSDISLEEAERRALEQRGQFLARQDMWEILGREIRDLDRERAVTAGGMSKADLLALGARSDVTAPVLAAFADPGLMPQHAPRHGLRDLEGVLDDHPHDYGVALVVINAYIDIAWAWRGDGGIADIPADRRREFETKMARAADILDRFSPFEHDSPALAATRCALLAAQAGADQRIVDDYEDLIELDPANPRHMRAFGNHLLPRWFGSYQQLEIGARRSAVLTRDIWGMGGYAWTYLDALAVDPTAIEMLDVDFFLDAMRDILQRRPDQHIVNTFAAFCAVTLQQDRFPSSQATQLARAFDWILRDHLREVHPVIWAMAHEDPTRASGPAALDSIARDGEKRALRRIASHFAAEIRQGARIVFDESGPMVISPR
ncbi:hypothetical protein [Thalassovita aquimarina]|uniref:Uncharacterized protein n=1 Tax=Thalassovita aquimarina TaxID=2785917 RepID=A0ABS5HQY5_9RHOB|nr:hypothetical protein [Thalassovita aquimarina]MBR9651221.1 hypothetical protein [Thalassovita aquimarina]